MKTKEQIIEILKKHEVDFCHLIMIPVDRYEQIADEILQPVSTKELTADEMLKGCEHDGSYIPVNEVKRLMQEYATQHKETLPECHCGGYPDCICDLIKTEQPSKADLEAFDKSMFSFMPEQGITASKILEDGINDGSYADILDTINVNMDTPFCKAVIQFAEDFASQNQKQG